MCGRPFLFWPAWACPAWLAAWRRAREAGGRRAVRETWTTRRCSRAVTCSLRARRRGSVTSVQGWPATMVIVLLRERGAKRTGGASVGMGGGETSVSFVEEGSVKLWTTFDLVSLFFTICSHQRYWLCLLKVKMTEENSRSWLAEAAGNYTTNMKYENTFSSFI